MSRRLDLPGKVVLVTGGARGIGLATAVAARKRGATVALLDRDGELAARRGAELGGVGLRADVTDLHGLETAVGEVVDRLGRIDVLVANAGIGPRTMTVDAGDREHQRAVLDVNVHGVWHTVWAAGREIVRQQGHLVVISSIAAYVLTPGWAAYAASKAAVEALARSMRMELAPAGVTVGVAHFGLVDTGLVREFEDDPIAARFEQLAPGFISRKASPRSAATALVRDIERRRSRTIYPSHWRAFYALRGVLGPLGDAVVVRDRRVRSLMESTRLRDAAATDVKAPR